MHRPIDPASNYLVCSDSFRITSFVEGEHRITVRATGMGDIISGSELVGYLDGLGLLPGTSLIWHVMDLSRYEVCSVGLTHASPDKAPYWELEPTLPASKAQEYFLMRNIREDAIPLFLATFPDNKSPVGIYLKAKMEGKI